MSGNQSNDNSAGTDGSNAPGGSNLTGGNAPQLTAPITSATARAIPNTFKLPKGHEPLDGSSNWDAWSFRLRNVFESEEAWDIVLGTETKPTGDAEKIQIWTAKDKAARITINLAIATTVIPIVSEAKTAAETWKALADAYGSKGLLTAFYYRSQLINYRFIDSQPFEQQIDQLRQLRIKQVAAGIPSPDWDFAISLLAALPDSYSVIKQSILARETDLNNLKVASIISLITQEEVERKGTRTINVNVDTEAAFALRQGYKQNNKGQRKRKDQDKTGTCNWCKREGHWEKECKKKKAAQAQDQQGADKSNLRRQDKNKGGGGKGDKTSPDSSWVAKIVDEKETEEEAKATRDTTANSEWWEFDSGATRVFYGNLEAFSDYKPFDKPIVIGLATSGASTQALGSGSLNILFHPPNASSSLIHITKAYYAPGMMNLVSISHLDDLGKRVQFFDKQINIWHGEKLELSVPRVGNSYKCRGDVVLPEKASAAKLSQDSWHRRWAHIGHSTLEEIARKELVNDFDPEIKASGSVKDHCDSCLRGKHARSPFSSTGRTRATKPLELVHADICGPFPPTREGFRYFLPFLDDHSEYGVVYRLKEKSGAADALKDYHVRAEKHTGQQLKAIQTDNGGEFEGEFERYLSLHGIHHRRSTPYTPQQNGVAERLNRTLNDLVVSCLIDANLGDSYWGDALLYTMYTRNHSPSRAIPGYVPYTLWNNGTKPSVAHLRPFGCTAYVHIPKKIRSGKLAPKSVKTIFLGYDSNRKAWRCYDPSTRKEYSSRDITFLEGVPYLSSKEALTLVTSTPPSLGTSNDDSDDSDDEDDRIPIPNPTSTSIPNSTSSTSTSPSNPSNPTSTSPSSNPPNGPPAPQPTGERPRRNIVPPTIHTDPTWMPRHHARMAYEFGLAATDPKTYRQAVSGPDAKQWEESINAEYQSLVDTGTFEEVDLPPGRRAIPCTYVFKEKTGPNGETIKFKTRIVARGDRQKKGVDFDKVFAPVPRLDTVRAVFAYAASQDWDIEQLDFKSAFLNGDLEEEVYVTPPEGIPITEGKVWRLKKTLYGLRQSPKGWHKKLTTTLKEFTLVRSSADFSLYIGRHGPDLTFLLTHVDDMAMTGNSRARRREIKDRIKERFPVEDLGPLDYYLAIKWTRDRARRTITGSQSKFALSVLERFNMLDCYPTNTPVVPNLQYTLDDCPTIGSEQHAKMSHVPYLEAIGSLMYLMMGTRPDLAYAIGKLSRFGHNPGKRHWKGVKRALQYLKGTYDYSLTLGGVSSGTPTLTGYSDASFQDCPDTSRSTSGYVFYLGDGPISWSSKRQSVVTNSTMEAEYLGLSNAARQAVWLRELLEDLHCTQTSPTTIFGDNNAALILAQDATDHSRAKHIKRVFHYVRERIEQEQDITVDYCPGKENIADIFTKPLTPELFSKFNSQLVSPAS